MVGIRGIVQVVTHKVGSVGEMTKALEKLSRKQALVGVPEETSTRPEDGDKINNAELLYILSHGVRKRAMREEMQKNIDSGMAYSKAHSLYLQEHGSPLWQIPPRPVLEPGIKSRQGAIAKQLAGAVTAAIHDDEHGVDQCLHQAGQIGEDGAKAWFENPANQWPPNSPKTIQKKGSDAPMIDTGEMRKSITHVVREM